MEAHRVETSRLQYFLYNPLTDDGEVVSPMHQPLLTTGRFLVLISVRGCVDPRAILWLEGLGQFTHPVDVIRNQTPTFWLVAQSLSHLCYTMPQVLCLMLILIII
jgi:hypothetical protein